MGFADQFRKWRRNSNQRDLASMMENNHIYEEEPTAAAAVIGADLPPSQQQQQQQTSNKKLRKPPAKQYPPSPDSYLNGIGDYTFIKQVGQGKFSIVMLSYHCLTRKQVAVKIIDKRVHDYRVMSRLVREISLMEVLNHPNIVRLYETYETTDSLYLVMEYVDGYNLDEYLQQKGGKLNENEARDIFRQMAAAMDYCHSKWVVHRDLKAPNILLTKDFQVKIADFGLGNRFGRRRLKTICGSMLYYSPEIINGQGYTGPEVDCWCLGVSLYRMTVGEEPFSRANTVGDLRKDVTAGQYVIPSHLSSELKSTIMKCMSVDKSKRTRVHMALKGDPWLFNQGQLPNIFSTTTVMTATVTLPSNNNKEDELTRQKKEKERLKYQHMRDMEEEKRSKKLITRTIICHPKNPSIYFTSAVPHSSKPEDTFTNSETQRHLLFQKMNEISRQIQLSSTQNAAGKSPIKHLLRKLKQPEEGSLNLRRNSHNVTSNGPSTALATVAGTTGPTTPGGPPQQPGRTIVRKSTSNMSLSQLYQRVTKDQVHYYTFQLTPQTAVRLTGGSDSSSIPAQQQDEFTMMLIIRGICDIMGITYHRDKNDHLICVMALSDYINEKPNNNKNSFYKLKRRDSKMNTSNPSLYYNNSNTTTGGASSSQASFKQSDLNRSSYFVPNNGGGGGSSRFSKFKRMTSHVLSSIFPYNSSTLVVHHQQQQDVSSRSTARYPPFPTLSTNTNSSSAAQQQQQQQQQSPTTPTDQTQEEENEEAKKSGVAIFAIEIISLSKESAQRITAIKFSKLDGSSKVFRIACGWLTGVIGQNMTPAQLNDNFNHLTAQASIHGSSTDIPHQMIQHQQQQQKRLSRPKSTMTLLPIAASQQLLSHPLDSPPPSSSGQFIVDDQQPQKKVVPI